VDADRVVEERVTGVMADPAAAKIEQAALAYAARGWSVVPVEPRGKRPIVAWQEFQQRVAGADEIASWFRHWPHANVAIVTGAVSGLVVLDVDPRHQGDRSLEALLLAHGPLPPTPEARTGGGGRHLYFAHPGGTVRNRVGMAPGLDLRGDGGCVVAPPSMHPSGRRYGWIKARGPDQVETAPLPRWLDDPLGARARPPGHPAAHWRQLARRGVREGERNATIASFAGHLLWRGVDPDVVRELLLAWNRVRCDPPLSDGELARVVDSIVRRHERDEGSSPESSAATGAARRTGRVAS
jgi:hypothetical protein